MVPDRYPSASPASIAAIGMALTAYVIGVDRGYITREQARVGRSRRSVSFAMRRRGRSASVSRATRDFFTISST